MDWHHLFSSLWPASTHWNPWNLRQPWICFSGASEMLSRVWKGNVQVTNWILKPTRHGILPPMVWWIHCYMAMGKVIADPTWDLICQIVAWRFLPWIPNFYPTCLASLDFLVKFHGVKFQNLPTWLGPQPNGCRAQCSRGSWACQVGRLRMSIALAQLTTDSLKRLETNKCCFTFDIFDSCGS